MHLFGGICLTVLWILWESRISVSSASDDDESTCNFTCNFDNDSTGYWSGMELCQGIQNENDSFLYDTFYRGTTSRWMFIEGPGQLFFKYFFRGRGPVQMVVTAAYESGTTKQLLNQSYSHIHTRDITGYSWIPVRLAFCPSDWVRLSITAKLESTSYYEYKLFGVDDIVVKSLNGSTIQNSLSRPDITPINPGNNCAGSTELTQWERWSNSITCSLKEYDPQNDQKFCGWEPRHRFTTMQILRRNVVANDVAVMFVQPVPSSENLGLNATFILDSPWVDVYAGEERFFTFSCKFFQCPDCSGELQICDDTAADQGLKCLDELEIVAQTDWSDTIRILPVEHTKKIRFRFVINMGIITGGSSSLKYLYLDKTWYSGEADFQFDTLLNSIDTNSSSDCRRPSSPDPNHTYNHGSQGIGGSTIVIICVVGFGLIFILAGMIYLIRTKRHKSIAARMKKVATLTTQEVKNAYKMSLYVSGSEQSKSSTKRPSVDCYILSPEFVANFPADFEAYAGLLDVSPTSLTLSIKVLGKGEFGTVHKGLAETLPFVSHGPVTVAVKSVNNPHDQQQQNMFAEEVKMMMKAGRHVNIVNILGIVRIGRPLLIMEYCQLGSLQACVRNRSRDGVIYSHVDEDGSLRPFDESEMRHQWLSVCDRNEAYDPDVENMRRKMLSTSDLIRISHQISRGMEYLASREIIHRDLAARNVLLTEGLIAKISDFGLAKHGGQSYTVSNGLIALPILWMPPDTIISREFSEKSDVWSFGVTLWEIFSLGQVPFDQPNVQKFSAVSFAEWLLEGHQMSRPNGAPSSIYSIMKSCWRLQTDDRPTFTEIWKELDFIVSSANTECAYLPLDEAST